MKLSIITGVFAALLVIFLINACNKELTQNPFYEPGEENAGGINTIELESSATFDTPSPALTADELQKHRDGLVFFEGKYVTNPAPINGGLGPIFNATSCEGCHVKNGRAGFPNIQNDLGGLLLRISVPGYGPNGSPKEVPFFGGQLQTKAIIGKIPEAQVNWSFEYHDELFSDGDKITLRKPIFNIINPYTSLPGELFVSPRIAPPVFGLGLLEAVDETSILANADEFDSNNDGISGRPNYVYDDHAQKVSIGKFGWKANQPNLTQQTAKAFHEDMGVTSTMYKEESSHGQDQYDNLNDDEELSFNNIELATFYTASLGAPKRRNTTNATVLKGKQLFIESKCGSCHTPKLQTGTSIENPFNSGQQIYPYTDLLLHDMGKGLADGRQDFLANGNEWRTPPLWGIGLTEVVNGHTSFLHDGRANSLMEAILWHGGEAEKSKEAVKKMNKNDRNALIEFLKSL